MLTNRFSKIFAGLLMLVVAFVSIDYVTTGISSKKAADTGLVISNTYLPLPPGKQTELFNAARGAEDFYQRHPDWTWTVRESASASSDYFQRHPELTASSMIGIGASDYFQRHSELTKSVLGVGASDYFQRHAELIAPAQSTTDTSDYYFRHQMRSTTGQDLTDYYFRHSNS